MQLLTTKQFNGLQLDCYRDDSQQDTENAFWATREQIGKLLGYAEPQKALEKIHKRNKERLDMFSTVVKVGTVEGNRTVNREVIMYNFKGLLEICRYSQQPNANEVIDRLWEIADEIRKFGMYISPKVLDLYQHDQKTFYNLLDHYICSQDELHNLREKIIREQSYTTLGKIVMAQSGCVTFQEAAAFLAQHGIDTGQNRLFEYCRKKRWLCSRKGKQWNKPTKNALDKGLLNLQISGKNHTITVITPGGLSHLTDDFSREFFPIVRLMEDENDDYVLVKYFCNIYD